MRFALRIAIVDDSSSVRMMVSICLDELGVREDEIFEYPSATVALMDFEKLHYDIIFCDLHMPEMDGSELIQKVYENFEHLKSARVVMISGEEDSSYKNRLKKFDVRQFIKKPIQPKSFSHHIAPLIEKIRRKENKT